MVFFVRLFAVVSLLLLGAFGGWLGSALLPPSPVSVLFAGQGNGGAGMPPGAGGGGGGMPPTPVLLAQSVEHRFEDRVRAVGSARAVQSISVQPRTTGRLAAIHVEAGDVVQAGDILFEVESTEEEARLAEAQARADDARGRYERNQAASSAVPRAQIEQFAAELAVAEAQVALAEYALDNTRVTAPFDGTIGLIGPSRGAMVGQDTSLTTLDDRSRMKVSFTVPERYIGGLSKETPVIARSSAFSDTPFDGVISSFDGRVDETTRSLRLEALIDNEDGHLRPGMFLTIDLSLEPRDLIAVPEDGLMIQGGDAFVFIVDEENVAHRKPIDIVQRQDGLVAVRGDIAVGERVITAGQTRAQDGATVRPVDQDETDEPEGLPEDPALLSDRPDGNEPASDSAVAESR